jgi:DNA modification methylase
MVEVFRHVRRVLRDDGVLWLNLGDSYAGSGKGPSGNNGIPGQSDRQGWEGSYRSDRKTSKTGSAGNWQSDASTVRMLGVPGYKPKDLLMIPFRVAMALQADGWWLRSVIPWLKRNSMPESVTDRPATSVEYVFLLAKSRTYYWDADAVRMANSAASLERYKPGETIPGRQKFNGSDRANPTFLDGQVFQANGRNLRNADFFFQTWQGLMLDEQDDPLALVVNPAPFSGSHFATFPPKLVEPMVKASTRPGDTILDPFGGAGTVGLVADRLQRNAILCELKAEYAEMGMERITGDAPMFAEVAAD